jgi:hypothetical protein
MKIKAGKVFYHGGPPKLKEILPPSKTGSHSTADYGGASVCRKDRVYATTILEMAMFAAATHPYGVGTVYEVVPMGEIGIDPDTSHPATVSCECEWARIVRKVRVKKKHLAQIRRAAFSGVL